MRSMYWQLGILGTISAFAFRHRETKKNLCRGGRSQDLVWRVEEFTDQLSDATQTDDNRSWREYLEQRKEGREGGGGRLFGRYYSNHQLWEDEVDRACCMDGTNEQYVEKFFRGTWNKADHQEALDVDGRALLKCTWKKWEEIMWTGLIWLGARSGWRSVTKELTNLLGVGVSWQAKRLLASEGLCCICQQCCASRKEQTA